MTYQWVTGKSPTDDTAYEHPENETAAPSANGNGGSILEKSSNSNIVEATDDRNDGVSLEEFALKSQWVNWREEIRNGRKTKVPFTSSGNKASSAEPDHRCTRAQADKAVAKLDFDGVGLVLGDYPGSDQYSIGGIDFDGCRDRETGEITGWPAQVIRRFASYSEISPSQTGAKAFFLYRKDDLPVLRQAMATQHSKSWSRGSHVEIALHLSNRYFTVTGDRLPSSPAILNPVSAADLLWLINTAGPEFLEGNNELSTPRDNSRSGKAFRLAIRMHHEGGDIDDFREAMDRDPELKEWATDERQVQRAWDNSAHYLPQSQPSRLSFLTPEECQASAPREYLWKGVLARRDIACIFGQPGVGKSLIAPFLAYKIAQGEPAFGMRTKPGAVLYIAAEDESGMKGRITALRDRYGDADDFLLACGVSNLSADSPDLKAVLEHVEGTRPSLIIIDTLAMAFAGLDENSSEAMGKVVAVAKQLTEHGAAVILVHHAPKSSEGGSQTPRGHSILNGALDMSMYLTKDENGVVRGRLMKNRNGSCDKDIAFKIGTRSFGTDEDGDFITSAFADPFDAPLVKEKKLTPSQQAALDVLQDMGGRAADSEWLASCIEGRLVSGSDDAGNRRRAARRAVLALREFGKVVFDHGIYNIPSQFDFDDLI